MLPAPPLTSAAFRSHSTDESAWLA